MQLGDHNNPDLCLQQRLQQVTVESSQLMGIIKSLNVEVYRAVLNRGVDPQLPEGLPGLSSEWYSYCEVSLNLHDLRSAHNGSCPQIIWQFRG